MLDKRVIVGPLNWGLGHATRCVPLIDDLIERGAEVMIASDGMALDYLRERYPRLPWRELPGYDITYRHSSMFFNMLLQSGKIRRAIRTEWKRTQQLVKEFQPDILLSDNRYGFYSAHCKSVILSHQLRFPALPAWLRIPAEKWLEGKLRKFDEIHVPDVKNGLSGKLSRYEGDIKYIGTLSRFDRACQEQEILYRICALISGPEPTRSSFAALAAEALSQLDGRHCLICGSRDRPAFSQPSNCDLYSFADGNDLQRLICSSSMVLCRSGYSTLMDLGVWGKPAILVPTPSQPEQEYLAKRMEEKGWATNIPEHRLGTEAIERALSEGRDRRVPDFQ